MIGDIEDGVLIDQVLGLGQGNVISGEFSNNISVAYKIEDGNITGRLKNTMVAGNVYQLLKDNVLSIGEKSSWVGGSLKCPPIAVKNVNIVQNEEK